MGPPPHRSPLPTAPPLLPPVLFVLGNLAGGDSRPPPRPHPLAPVLLVLGIWLGGHPDALPGPIRDALVGDTDAQTIDRAIDEVHGDYYRPIPRDALVDAALGGMARSLHDRFSRYFTAKQYGQ